ncbi:hypothetical protein NKH77_19455 [Streptomyces sp. M19]
MAERNPHVVPAQTHHPDPAPRRRPGRVPAGLGRGRLGRVRGGSGPGAGAGAGAAVRGDGSVTDPNIAYVGRWDTSDPTAAVPNWTGAYLWTAFTGTTARIKSGTR